VSAAAVAAAAAAESMVTKSLDNIVGSLWQARQESSGSSMGNQVRKKRNWFRVYRWTKTNFKVITFALGENTRKSK
jgi:hypothetical protein